MKRNFIKKIISGILLAALAATAVDVEILKKPFGVFLLAAGVYTVFQKGE